LHAAYRNGKMMVWPGWQEESCLVRRLSVEASRLA